MKNEQKTIAKYYFLMYEVGVLSFDEARRIYRKWCDEKEQELLGNEKQ